MKREIIILFTVALLFCVSSCATTSRQGMTLKQDNQEASLSERGPKSPEAQDYIKNHMVCRTETKKAPSTPPVPKEEAKPAPKEEAKPEPGSEIEERLKTRAEALNRCQDAGENNAALRLEQGKDYARLYLLLVDEASRAAQLDNAFVQFLQSIRDLPTREGCLFLAYTQKEKGWLGKSKVSLRKAGCTEWTWKQLDGWVKAELANKPRMKAEGMMPTPPAKKEPAKKAFKRKQKTQLELYREFIDF